MRKLEGLVLLPRAVCSAEQCVVIGMGAGSCSWALALSEKGTSNRALGDALDAKPMWELHNVGIHKGRKRKKAKGRKMKTCEGKMSEDQSEDHM